MGNTSESHPDGVPKQVVGHVSTIAMGNYPGDGCSERPGKRSESSSGTKVHCLRVGPAVYHLIIMPMIVSEKVGISERRLALRPVMHGALGVAKKHQHWKFQDVTKNCVEFGPNFKNDPLLCI